MTSLSFNYSLFSLLRRFLPLINELSESDGDCISNFYEISTTYIKEYEAITVLTKYFMIWMKLHGFCVLLIIDSNSTVQEYHGKNW